MIVLQLSDLTRASLWVDADGALLVATNPEDATPLPEGAYQTRQLLVTDEGRLLISEL